jgi:hypothetical protein
MSVLDTAILQLYSSSNRVEAAAELARLREAEELVEWLRGQEFGIQTSDEYKLLRSGEDWWVYGYGATLYRGPSLHDALQALRGEQ